MLRLGVIPDFREENWFSMDLVADMLLRQIREGRAGEATGESLSPEFAKRFTRLPIFGSRGLTFNADRLLNRMRDYPNHLKRVARDFDAYHVCDHAYANVVHALPAERSGVFCHDLDTFRCLFEPQKEPRPHWFKAMMRRVLSGMQKAAIVFHTTSEIRRQIVERGIVDESRLVQARYGVSPVFVPSENTAENVVPSLLPRIEKPFVLHVGSCMQRKRIDVLLNVFAEVRKTHSNLRLIQVGGEWSPEQRAQLKRLSVERDVEQIGRMTQEQIAAMYRRAVLVMQPSDSEGFGLPVAEALACGSIVVASAIPALLEVGGDAAVYCPPGEVGVWVSAVDRLLNDPLSAPTKVSRFKQAAQYSWANHARIICDSYRLLV